MIFVYFNCLIVIVVMSRLSGRVDAFIKYCVNQPNILIVIFSVDRKFFNAVKVRAISNLDRKFLYTTSLNAVT